MFGTLLPVFMGSLDGTILASALPTIGRDFGDFHNLPWLITAYLIFVRHPMGQILGVLWAAISAALAVFMIFVAPIWALVVLAIDMTVIWALLAATDEFDTA